MAQTVASMAGLHGSAQAVLDGSRQISGSGLLISSASTVKPSARPNGIRAQHSTDAEATISTRRAMLGLVAAGIGAGSFVQAVLADATPIKIGPPPPLSGGLPGTLNSDEPRDVDLPLKSRFFIQPLPADLAAKRAKESAQEIVGVKSFISKGQWPYVRMDLRNKASYLRYDIDTVIAAKSKEDKKPLKELTKDLFAKIDQLDYAAKIKSLPAAEKYYAETVSALDTVIAKLG